MKLNYTLDRPSCPVRRQKKTRSNTISESFAVFPLAALFTCISVFLHAQTTLWGVNQGGGTDNKGTLGYYDPANSSWTTEFNFTTDAPGAVPSDLIEWNGKFYGVTRYGGMNHHGILFEWDPDTNAYTKKVDFNSPNGAHPVGSLTVSQGKFYGMTSAGGGGGYGVIFEWDPATNAYNKKVDFNSTNGAYPYGSLTFAEGKFYGTTSAGGINGYGVIFEWDPATNAYVKKVDFNSKDGAHPHGSLTYRDGKFYGTTATGGTTGWYGVIFEWDPATNTFSKKVDFNLIDGARPSGSLIFRDGKFYGMTERGGTKGYGVIFEWDPSTNAFNKKVEFDDANGAHPFGSLANNDGKFYGTTGSGGAMGYGVLFEWDPYTNLYSKKIDFSAYYLHGGRPGSLSYSRGKFYGTTYAGGSGSGGVIFEWEPLTNAYNKKVDFNSYPNGARPVGPLAYHDGKFYGMTSQGGANDVGIIFEWDPLTRAFNKKVDFTSTSGGSPTGSLSYHEGRFYGMTRTGGGYGYGVIFEWDPTTNSLTKKVEFTDTNGRNPTGSMTYHEGKFYGMTAQGGANDTGVLFEWDPATNQYNKTVDFYGANGVDPYGSLTFAEGKFYGMTSAGGGYGYGVIFEWDPATNVFSKKTDFTGTNGANPYGSLTYAESKFYGMTVSGGNYGYGVIFEWDPSTNAYSKKVDLDQTNGSAPGGSLTYSEGKFYGTTQSGGVNGLGVVFEWDAVSNTYLKKIDLSPSTGSSSVFSQLTPAKEIHEEQHITFDPLPASTYGDEKVTLTGSSSSGLTLTYTSSNPAVATISENILTIVGAGSSEITASQAGNENYNPAEDVVQILTVNKAPLTVTAENKTKTYGDPNPEFTYSYSGFKGTDGPNAIDTLSTGTTSASATSAVGQYPIVPIGGDDNNYSFHYVQGTLIIEQAVLTVTAENKTKIYGDLNPEFTYSYSGFKGTDGPSAIDTLSTATTSASATSAVGQYPIVPIGGNDNNYRFNYVDGTLTIEQAVLTVTADNKTKLYGDPNPEFTYSYSGFKGTDGPNAIDTLSTATTSASATSHVGDYPIILSRGYDNNYSFLLVNGTLTIQKAGLKVTADDKSKMYGDAVDGSLTISYSGFKGVDDASDLAIIPTASTTVTSTSDAGTYDIIPAGGDDDNYALLYVNGIYSVNKLTLTATADDKTRVYGQENPPLTLTYSGFLTGEDATVVDLDPSLFTAATIDSPPGDYSITPDGGSDNNYDFYLVSGTLTITEQTTPTPGQPTSNCYLTIPGNNSVNVNYYATLAANFVVGAKTYTFEVNTQPDFSGIPNVKQSSSESIEFLLDYNTKYYARVKTDLAPDSWSVTTTFTTGNPVSLAYITSPEDGATGVPTNVKVTANNIYGATSYTIELNTSIDFSGLSITQTSAERSIAFKKLEMATKYYARVSTDLAPGQWGGGTSFTTLDPRARSQGGWEGEDLGDFETQGIAYHVYPNPFKQNLTILVQTLEQGPAEIMLFDVNGKVLDKFAANTNSLIVFGESLSNGVYVLQVVTAEGTKFIRIIKH